MEYETFDIAVALYFWLQHNWEGQTDDLYSDFCILTEPGMYKPGMCLDFDTISEESKEIYNELTRENYSGYLDKVLNYESQD